VGKRVTCKKIALNQEKEEAEARKDSSTEIEIATTEAEVEDTK
jgi:hypothetical protein